METQATDHSLSFNADHGDSGNLNGTQAMEMQTTDHSLSLHTADHHGDSGNISVQEIRNSDDSCNYCESDDQGTDPNVCAVSLSESSSSEEGDSCSYLSDLASDFESSVDEVDPVNIGSNPEMPEQERQALSLLTCFLRNKMPASACKDVIQTFQKAFPDFEAVQKLNYVSMWNSVTNCADDLKEFHYCSLCNEVFPENQEIYNCASQGCDGVRYKGTNQTKAGRQPQQRFVFADIKKQLQLLLESTGKDI